MGIIGKMHGVNDSNNPKPKKAAMFNNKPPFIKFCVIVSCADNSTAWLPPAIKEGSFFLWAGNRLNLPYTPGMKSSWRPEVLKFLFY